MNMDKKITLAKKVVQELSVQGVSVDELCEICDLSKKIAGKTQVSTSCVELFNGWFD